MEWKLGDAKQRLSEVVRNAAREPQVLYNRDRPVAAVISVDDLAEFTTWQASRRRVPLAERLAEARRIAEEEGIELTPPPRSDRPNPLLAPPRGRPRAPRRHQRRQ